MSVRNIVTVIFRKMSFQFEKMSFQFEKKSFQFQTLQILSLSFVNASRIIGIIISGGGIRAGFEAGVVNLASVLKVLPFANNLCTFTVPGMDPC